MSNFVEWGLLIEAGSETALHFLTFQTVIVDMGDYVGLMSSTH